MTEGNDDLKLAKETLLKLQMFIRMGIRGENPEMARVIDFLLKWMPPAIAELEASRETLAGVRQNIQDVLYSLSKLGAENDKG